MQRKLAIQRKQLVRLKHALKKKEEKCNEKKALSTLRKLLPKQIVDFVEMQLKLHKKRGKGRRYSPKLKSFSLSLYHVSGRAYRLLSKFFYLPSKRSLRRWVSRLPGTPGITEAAINVIETKVKVMNSISKICSLCIDEMSLKTNLIYDISADEVLGFVDLGAGKKCELIATSALVVMACGMADKWKQPLGYFLVHESCKSIDVKRILFDAIDKLDSIGLKVVCVISDLGSNFQKLVRELGVTPTQPWFLTESGKKIIFLYDPPHLIKAVRNNLMKYDFHFGGKVASWQDVKSLYDRDSSLSIRCCPKLTDKHINPNGFTKMKVKLATQVLSHTVAAAISTYVSLGAMSASAAGTAEFITAFDKIFDCLNSSSVKYANGKLHRKALSDSSVHLKFLTDEAIPFLSSIKVINRTTGADATNTLRCLKGFQITLHGILALWSELRSAHSFKFLLTRRLNQDPLENFFGTVRQQGGNSDNPTPGQFRTAFKKLFYDNFLVSSAGNCNADFNSMLVGAPSQNVLSSLSKTVPKAVEIDVNDYRSSSVQDSLIGTNAVAYVAGYLLKKCLLKHDCKTCKGKLVSQELDDSSKMFCFFKAYHSQTGPFGGLLAPASNFQDYIVTLEDMFVESLPSVVFKVGVGKSLLSQLPQFSLPECSEFPSLFLLKLFIRMRLYYALKFRNRQLLSPGGSKKCKKYFKVSHL
jgi:hypothetical protein